jgi:hypothetical protein
VIMLLVTVSFSALMQVWCRICARHSRLWRSMPSFRPRYSMLLYYTNTWQHFRARHKAIARPIPALLPVTYATALENKTTSPSPYNR